MRKRNKLYTINRWNRPLLGNTFDEGGNLLQWDKLASQAYGANYGEEGYTLDDYMGSKNGLGIAKKDNPFSKGNIGTTGQAAAGAVLSTPIGDKALDTFDPVYHLAGGRESAVGNGLSDAGKSIFKASAASGNGWGMLAGAGLKIVGGLTNAAFGIKTDKQALQNANNAIDYYSNFNSTASRFDDVTGVQDMGSFQNPYKGGWFSGGKARKKNAALKKDFLASESWANRSVDNNINNIANTQMNNMLANYSAFGGPLGNQGALDYGFTADYLSAKNKAAGARDRIPTNPFGSLPVTPLSTFALGGDIQTNGADFTTGLSEVNAGGSHEENPYEGVQVGISRENGQPNLVEEGETIFDDYVYSRRIKADERTKKKFHIGKNTDISYADLSKKLQKESLERPNDPISQRALTMQLHELAEEQERQKAEEQAQEEQDLFATLPPEQQEEIMQQIALQEQQAQQMQEQQAMQQGTEGVLMQEQPEEQQAIDPQMQQQTVQEQQMEQPQIEGEQINACGGKMNRYDKGGDLKKAIYKALKTYTDSDFDRWAKDNNVGKITDWEKVLSNKQFMEALKKKNPSLGDVLTRGYDFGAYKAPKDSLTFDFAHGGWGLEDYDAWDGSTDAAWQEALKKGLVKKGMNSEEIGKALMQTDSYKRGTDWLKANEQNRLSYLQSIYNSKEAPEAARAYAGKYVDANGWLKDARRDYQTIFEDPNGQGVRNTHPGTYWKTPNEVLRDRQAMNYVLNDDGTAELIYNEVPQDWEKTDSYVWQDEKGDNEANYYRRPKEESTEAEEDNTIAPKHKPTWGRAVGLFGPAVGLGMQMAGIGKPDYSGVNASLDIMNGAPATATFTPIGSKLTYKPLDTQREQNRLDANSRATDRAILNNSSPLGTKTAGLLANGYNNMTTSGDLGVKAQSYNDAQRMQVANYNRGTDQFNAEGFNRTSITNAQMQNSIRQASAQMAMEAARQKMAADAAWNQGIYGNVAGLFKGIGDWGTENARHNMVADMAADGIFGTIGDKQNIGKRHVTKRCKGGKMNRKKGLTY